MDSWLGFVKLQGFAKIPKKCRPDCCYCTVCHFRIWQPSIQFTKRCQAGRWGPDAACMVRIQLTCDVVGWSASVTRTRARCPPQDDHIRTSSWLELSGRRYTEESGHDVELLA